MTYKRTIQKDGSHTIEAWSGKQNEAVAVCENCEWRIVGSIDHVQAAANTHRNDTIGGSR